ncbi:MAG: hypothetical protein ACPGWR_19270 [Ardenticatenaceae bacterium]
MGEIQKRKRGDWRGEMEDRRWKMEDRRSKMEDRRWKIEDGRSKIEDRRSKIEDGRSKIEDRRSKIEDGALQEFAPSLLNCPAPQGKLTSFWRQKCHFGSKFLKSRRWEMGDGRWEACPERSEGSRWQMGDGRWKIKVNTRE